MNLGSRRPAAGGILTGITGALSLTGGSSIEHRDTLTVDDTGTLTGNTGTLTLTALTGLGLGAPVNYLQFEAVKVALGAGDDIFTLSGGSSAYTIVDGGAGNNVIN